MPGISRAVSESCRLTAIVLTVADVKFPICSSAHIWAVTKGYEADRRKLLYGVRQPPSLLD